MQSGAKTVNAYLKGLPPERRAVIAAVRKVVLEHLPEGYEESMTWGYPSYEVPLKAFADTYNGKPLCYAALAAHKSTYTLYLMGVYADPKVGKALASEFQKRGKTLDMGKSCLHFKSLDDLPLDVVGSVIASTPVDRMVEFFKKSRRKGKGKREKGEG